MPNRAFPLLLCLASGTALAQAGPPGPGPGPGPGPAPGAVAPALPPVTAPPGNPTTPEKVLLGMALFWDEQLSSDHTVACATCHAPEAAGADLREQRHPGPDTVFGNANDVFGSPGVIAQSAPDHFVEDATFGLETQVTGRAAPSLSAAPFAPLLFWDGRAGASLEDPETGATVLLDGAALEAQALGPLLNDVEMSHIGRPWSELTAELQDARPLALAPELTPTLAAAITASTTYADLFADAFGSSDVTPVRIAMALAAYERTLVADETPYDAFVAGDATALTADQQRGLTLVQGPPCGVCHGGPSFTNHSFRNIGLRPPGEDPGREDVTGDPADRGRHKVPGLRNVVLKPRFMHTGHLTSLDEVLDFYLNVGGQQFPQNQDPAVPLIQLTPADRAAVLDFLSNGLTDPRAASGTGPFEHPTLHAALDACRNGIDDDGDGWADLDDPGCGGDGDTSELTTTLRCDNGLDDDGDGLVDQSDDDCDLGIDTSSPLAGCLVAPGSSGLGVMGLPFLLLLRRRRH